MVFLRLVKDLYKQCSFDKLLLIHPQLPTENQLKLISLKKC